MLAIGSTLLVPLTAEASRGVAIDIGSIDIAHALDRGGSYTLPVVGVRNPGDQPTGYELQVTPVEGQRVPPASWFEFSPRRFTLQPGATRAVAVRLIVPAGAAPARYGGLLAAGVVGDAPGPHVGAAAAARISFVVRPSNLLQAWWLWLKRHVANSAPWSYLVPALLAAALASARVRRSYSLTIVRRS